MSAARRHSPRVAGRSFQDGTSSSACPAFEEVRRTNGDEGTSVTARRPSQSLSACSHVSRLPGMSALQIVAIVVCLGVTAVAVALLVKTVNHFLATFRLGQPEDRRHDKGARTRTLVREFLGHTRMSRLPVVAMAHWFTMVSFGILFFTLLNAFGQLSTGVRAAGHRPLLPLRVGHRLLRLRRLPRHPRAHRDPAEETTRARPPVRTGAAAASSARRGGRPTTSSSTILGVTICIGLLRALEWTLARKTGTGMDTALHFPLTGWSATSSPGSRLMRSRTSSSSSRRSRSSSPSRG